MKLVAESRVSFWSQRTAPTRRRSESNGGNTYTTLVPLLVSPFICSQMLLVLTHTVCSRGRPR